MPDIHCKQCGEPWSIYSLRHEVPGWEDQPDDAYKKVMRGEGCPTCDWGEKAGEVSLSQSESKQETEARHIKSIMENSDEDPLRYI